MANATSHSKFPLRQFLTWCLPALAVGALLRLGTLVAIPEAYYASDSTSYFETTVKLWSHRHLLVLQEKRRWIYPLLCLPLPALPWSPAVSVACLQHLLGLAVVVGAGWITAHSTRYRAVWVPIVTLLAASDLWVMNNEHAFVGDGLFLAAIVATAALGLPPERLRERRRLFWFLLMAAVVAAIKPHGRGIWLGSILAAMLITRKPWQWKPEAWVAVAAGVVVVFTTGEKLQAKWLLLSSTLPLVDLDGTKWANYRQALKPLAHDAQRDFALGRYAWTERMYKVPLGGDGDPSLVDPVWAELAHRKDKSEYLQVCGDLAREAIWAHPFAFARLTLTKIGVAFTDADPIALFDPPQFWKAQEADNAPRWAKYPTDLRLYYGRDQPAYEQLVDERRTRRNFAWPMLQFLGELHQTEPFVWARTHYDPASKRRWLTPGCLGLGAIFGLLWCLRPSRFVETSVVWLPSLLLMLTVFAVGDSKVEYTEPVRWAGLVMIAIGLDSILVWLLSKFQSTGAERPMPASTS